MSELLNGIFKYLDIDSYTGLATKNNMQSMNPFQRLFYTQVHEKIGIDAVYFLRDANGVAKVPLIYFSSIHKYDAKQVAELHRLSWNLGEAPLLCANFSGHSEENAICFYRSIVSNYV